MDEGAGLYASLTPRSSIGVVSRENMSNNLYETPCVELHVPSDEKPVQLCDEEAATSRSQLSTVSFSVVDDEPETNAGESLENDMQPCNTYSLDTKALSIMTAQPV